MDPQFKSVAEDLSESERPAGRRASPAAEESASPGFPLRRVTRGPGEGQYRGNGN